VSDTKTGRRLPGPPHRQPGSGRGPGQETFPAALPAPSRDTFERDTSAFLFRIATNLLRSRSGGERRIAPARPFLASTVRRPVRTLGLLRAEVSARSPRRSRRCDELRVPLVLHELEGWSLMRQSPPSSPVARERSSPASPRPGGLKRKSRALLAWRSEMGRRASRSIAPRAARQTASAGFTARRPGRLDEIVAPRPEGRQRASRTVAAHSPRGRTGGDRRGSRSFPSRVERNAVASARRPAPVAYPAQASRPSSRHCPPRERCRRQPASRTLADRRTMALMQEIRASTGGCTKSCGD